MSTPTGLSAQQRLGATQGSDRRCFISSLAALAAAGASGLAHAQDEYGDAGLRGAGSTFVQPLMEEWVRQYRLDPYQVLQGSRAKEGGLSDALSNDGLDYEAVGSLAGIQRIRAGFVDFAASEMPLGPDYLSRSGLIQFPWTTGSVAIVINAGTLQLDAATLAGIYLGSITTWADPAIASLNPGVRLLDASIVAVHRSDGSGTTFTMGRYLTQVHAGWRARLGADLLLKWPGGADAKGSDEMVRRVKATPHSIGYVNAVQARRAGLPIVSLRNRSGRAVLPTAASVSAALTATGGSMDAVDRLPIDAAGEASYPLIATVFGLMRQPIASARQRRTADFVRWTLSRGAPIGERLGYTSLPEHVARISTERLSAKS